MNPSAMLTILVAAIAAFAWSANRRWQLLKVGRPDDRLDRLADRFVSTWRYAFKQEKMDYYNPAGIAHKAIFLGFGVLLLRSLILWGRGFSPAFNFWWFAPWQPLGQLYEFLKDTFAVLVLAGVSVFFYYRIINPQKRMTLHFEGILILLIIATMMLADMTYDGASLALAGHRALFCGGAAAAAAGEGGGAEAAKLVASPDQCAAIATILAPYSPTAHAGFALYPSPAGSFFSSMFANLQAGTLIFLAHAGFWTHSTLVLLFLNLLPHSKHFHIITAIPNVFTRDLHPPGRLAPMAANAEQLAELVGAAGDSPDPLSLPVGVARIEHFTWKAILDFYTCTECGRCSDNCPAHRTGKILSPKHLTLDLRDHLYHREREFIERAGGPKASNGVDAHAHGPADGHGSAGHGAGNGHGHGQGQGHGGDHDDAHAEGDGHDDHDHDDHDGHGHHEPVYPDNPVIQPPVLSRPVNLSDIIHPDVLWGCTTCRACEEQCPVLISYVDKIVDMRRNLVMIKGELPAELQKALTAIEVNGNPWNLSRMDRANWAEGLGIPTLAEFPKAPVLYWVGCAASYDDRAKKIARATARLMKAAGVEFAILAQEENCTGDPARRAGNEFLFATLAEANAATLNGYKEQGGVRQVVTTCPHCFNTLKNEYPDFGCKLEVIHHTDFLLGLLSEKKLNPRKPVNGKVVYHDSCYLGRYNGVYESPREILRRIPGVQLAEPEYWTKSRGLCCGAGGAQMWMEEQNSDRVNVKRTLQLLETKPATIASACPFCMTMLTDGLKSQSMEEKVAQMDVAELLEKSCALDEPIGIRAAMPQDPPRVAPSALH
jgi:Fe-S oxidoreductase